MASTITLCRTAFGGEDTMRRAGQLAEGTGKYERRAAVRHCPRGASQPRSASVASGRAMVAVRRLPLSVGLLVLLAVAWRAQWAFQFVKPRANGGWVLLAALLALCALWMVAERSAAPGAADRPPLGGRREWLAVGALCALGIACRIVHFSSVPGGMNHDAAFNGMYALGVLQGAPYTPYISAAWGRETLFMYLCTPLVAWLGNVPEPIQIAATLVAVATLPVFYLFARALFPARVAL